MTGNTGELYARTGYLGFLRRTEAIGSDGGKLKVYNIQSRLFFLCILNFSVNLIMISNTFFRLS